MKTRVIIDPTSRILYSSFYIKGLFLVFGKKNVSFSAKYFKELKRRKESHSHDHYMAFVVINPDNIIHKFIIDFRDKPSIKESAYEWCDKYAKINFNINLTNKRFHNKIISIPPGFGIRVWNLWETAYYCCSNFVKFKFSPIVKLKPYLGDYYHQWKRPKLGDYLTSSNDKRIIIPAKPYIFMIGTLWKHENCTKETNLIRKTFIEACKTESCNFEGGFFASENHPQYSEYKDFIFKKRYSVNEYIQKTKLSSIVFNTPAVHNCHGWKLGEYLAMGKTIISTPISNLLPEGLEHGKNIHIVHDLEELKYVVNLLIENCDYRKILSNGSKDYYLKYGSPEKVIEYIYKK
ncbi:hypothetical protein [Maribacter arcticus]|uniref:glycosyltransferase n=1 Tax=Maribacter arcticus TaxID=561365 RepID=UPI003000FE21